jgi:hypothetical protein
VPATRKRCTKHAPSSKTECGHLNGGKSKAVTYAFPPGYRENAEEEEGSLDLISKKSYVNNKIKTISPTVLSITMLLIMPLLVITMLLMMPLMVITMLLNVLYSGVSALFVGQTPIILALCCC